MLAGLKACAENIYFRIVLRRPPEPKGKQKEALDRPNDEPKLFPFSFSVLIGVLDFLKSIAGSEQAGSGNFLIWGYGSRLSSVHETTHLSAFG